MNQVIFTRQSSPDLAWIWTCDATTVERTRYHCATQQTSLQLHTVTRVLWKFLIYEGSSCSVSCRELYKVKNQNPSQRFTNVDFMLYGTRVMIALKDAVALSLYVKRRKHRQHWPHLTLFITPRPLGTQTCRDTRERRFSVVGRPQRLHLTTAAVNSVLCLVRRTNQGRVMVGRQFRDTPTDSTGRNVTPVWRHRPRPYGQQWASESSVYIVVEKNSYDRLSGPGLIYET